MCVSMVAKDLRSARPSCAEDAIARYDELVEKVGALDNQLARVRQLYLEQLVKNVELESHLSHLQGRLHRAHGFCHGGAEARATSQSQTAPAPRPPRWRGHGADKESCCVQEARGSLYHAGQSSQPRACSGKITVADEFEVSATIERARLDPYNQGCQAVLAVIFEANHVGSQGARHCLAACVAQISI